MPEAFLPVCEALNHGYFDPATRFVTSTLGLRAKLPNAAGKDPSQSLLIMRTMGWIGSAGFQIGGGVGTFISGLLLGSIFCCAGGRSQLGAEDLKKIPKEVDPLVDGSNVKVNGQIATTGDPSDKAKSLSKEPAKAAVRVLKDAVDLLRRAGIFDDINEQLRKDRFNINVTIVIRLDDKLAIDEAAAYTECGDGFVGIEIRVSAILEPDVDGIIESLYDTLIHELIHAKQCPYQKAGKALPYGEHDTEPFKAKVKELLEKAKQRAKKDETAKADELKNK